MLIPANIFQPLIDVFEAVIKFFHDTVGVPWGFSIVLLTIAVRAVMIPLTVRQFHSMRNMQAVQPQLKEIQNKYKDDKQRQQQELMKFYKENNVNPLASCLPLVAQLPVFISLFYMLRKSLRNDICPGVQALYREHFAALHHVALKSVAGETIQCGKTVSGHFDSHGAGFLFIHDLTNKATGAVLIVLIVLYVGTQLGSTLMMRSPTMDKTQQNLMLFMPLIFVLLVIGFPAGVLVYWITTNTWTMAQQFVIKRRLGPPGVAVATAGGTGGAGPRGGGNTPVAPTPSSVGAGGASGGLGGALRSKLKPSEPAAATAQAARGAGAAPPPPPRKKKKRSGRRR